MRILIKNFILIILIFLAIAWLFNIFALPSEKEKEVPFNQLVKEINEGRVKKITVSGNDLLIVYQDNSKGKSKKEPELALSQSLLNYGVDKENLSNITIETKEASGIWVWLGPLLISTLPFLFFLVLFWFFLRQVKSSGASQVFDFTKAKARLFLSLIHI